MPKISLVLGRRTLNVFELDRPRFTVGRSPDTDIPIDNVSVSRNHAEIFRTEDGWMVKDANSSNGTFLNGDRLTQPRPLKRGDEISIGKFSLFFDRIMEGAEQAPTRPHLRSSKPQPDPVPSGTRFIKPTEVEELRKASAERRKAKLAWKGSGQEGEHTLPDEGAVLVGKGDLCDLRTPAGPKHHLLIIRDGEGWEARNLSWWHGMKVNGSKRSRATLSGGDTIEIGGLTVTYRAAVS